MLKNNRVLGLVFAVLAMACGGDDKDKDEQGLDCAEAFLCAADCRNESCIESCMDDASPAARQQMIALATCYEESGCEDDACLEEECEREVNACGGLDELGGDKPQLSVSVE